MLHNHYLTISSNININTNMQTHPHVHAPTIMDSGNGGAAWASSSVHVEGSRRIMCAVNDAASKSRNPREGIPWLSLDDALQLFFRKGTYPNHLCVPHILAPLHVQLVNKWNYAAYKYRFDHPGVLPLSKPGEGPRACSRLLPIEVAEEKMLTWIPWAVQEIRVGFDHLAPLLPTLTTEQVEAVEVEPEIDEDDEI